MRQLKVLALDLALITAATLIGLLLRDNLVFSWANVVTIAPYLMISLVCATAILPLAGINRMMWRFSGLSEYGRLVFSCAAIVMLAVLIGFAALRMENVPRSLPIMQGVIMVMLMVGVRVIMRARRFRHIEKIAPIVQKSMQEAVIVVGLNTVAELFIQAVIENPGRKIAIAGVIGRSDRHTGHLFRGLPILGTPDEIPQVLRDLDVHGVTIDRIIVAVGFDKLSNAARLSLAEIENSTQIKIDYFAERLGFERLDSPAAATSLPAKVILSSSSRTAFEARELLQARNRPYWRVKRRIDVALSAIALLALAPIMLVIGLMNAMAHGLPILFWQQRPGLDGQPFKVFKYRSLLGAHDELGQRLPDAVRETWFGRFLRATRLDELPQLVNIFKGHMSFVGPRPLLMTDQLEQFKDRLLVRPGLTGWAQVNGGKCLLASDKMALDLWYIRNASLALDLKIVFLTVFMVLFGERENQRAVDQAWLEHHGERPFHATD